MLPCCALLLETKIVALMCHKTQEELNIRSLLTNTTPVNKFGIKTNFLTKVTQTYIYSSPCVVCEVVCKIHTFTLNEK